VPARPLLDGGPCTPWATAEDVFGMAGESFDDSNDVNDAIAMAGQVLYALSGRQYSGECIGFVRPCRTGCGWSSGAAAAGAGVDLALAGANWWFGWVGGIWGWWNDTGNSCGCDPLSVVKLNGYPITGIKEVVINGEVLDASEYRLDMNRYLVRMRDSEGNKQVWPGCQDLNSPPGDERTWSIEYYYGTPPPLAGKLAACELAIQFYYAMTGSDDCVLSPGVTKVTRQGVTIERLVPLFMGPTNRTGLPITDAFLAAYNPGGLRRRPAIASPGAYPRFPRRTPFPSGGS
jgi:hypothetical protein